MSRPQLYRLGPFSKGLNNAVDPLTLNEAELAVSYNIDNERQGALGIRPRFTEYDFSTRFPSLSKSIPLKFIGKGLLNGIDYAFFVQPTVAGIYAWNATNNLLTLVTNSIKATTALQYGNTVYFIPESTVGGGRWDGTTFTASSNTPYGSDAIFYKSRLWVVQYSESQIKFTDPITPGTVNLDSLWTSTNLIQVGSGDGQNATAIKLYKDTLLIFKDASLWAFSYTVDPSLGVLQNVNTSIGATTKDAVSFYNNSYFVLFKNILYFMSNYNFTQFTNSIDFKSTAGAMAATPAVCVFGQYLVVQNYEKTYAYSFDSATWTQWRDATGANADGMDFRLGYIGTTVKGVPVAGRHYPLTTSGSTPSATVFEIRLQVADDLTEVDYVKTWNEGTTSFSSTVGTPINFTFTTRVFDYDYASQYKRILWAGVDAEITGPVALTVDVQKVSTTFNAGVTGNIVKRMIRFPARFRFREIQYTVSGTSASTLVNNTFTKVYAIFTSVGVKELVPRQVT